nr:hypothetical protein [uncultured archaeon]
MENAENLYEKIISFENLILAYKKARKGKTKKTYVIEFEKNLNENLIQLCEELKIQTYFPKPLETFIVRDPKTRKISKSDFRDRVIHHALVHILEEIYEQIFIYDSCANRIGKGTLFAIKRFDYFKIKATNNLHSEAFCLKADIKHYFQEVDHKILIDIINRRIQDKKVLFLIKKILANTSNTSFGGGGEASLGFQKVGMPLGNLTSQFFANVYLHELDYFIKHKLKAKYYIRYVDDFVILHKNKEQLELWKEEIEKFLKEKLKLELHKDKSKIVSLSKGVDFVGFRNFYYHKLLRKRNIKNILFKIQLYKKGEISKEKMLEIFQGFNAYAKWADSYMVRKEVVKRIYKT